MSSEREHQSIEEEEEEPQGREELCNAASSWDGQKKNLPGTPTPERPPASPSSNSSSGDTCSICLCGITDKCVADSCLHSFCLLCLKEWSKQKAVCPLCKLSFTKIMYEIKSETEYKEWKVPQPEPPERSLGIANFQEFLNAETRRFFGYRTTHFPGAATLRRMHGRSNIPDAIPSLPPQRAFRSSLRGTTMFRLSVYLNNVWVQPLADVTGRYRQTAPELYREQPALTHRLVPWVNRELASLLPPSRVATVLTEVMELIERYPINSREFRSALRPHLERRTRHFVHEFYHFARSPYDMVGHDNSAQYVPRYDPDLSTESDDSEDDSDAVVEVDSVGNPIASTSASDNIRNQPAPGVVREEILTHEGSVVISSSSSSSSEDTDNETERSHSRNTEGSYEMTHNPEPPLFTRRRRIGRAKRALTGFNVPVNEGASTSRSESASGRSADQSKGSLQGNPSENEDSDECIIVEEVLPKVPTPELIEIDSDEENIDFADLTLRLARKRKKLRGKSKPTLKRNNFLEVDSPNKGNALNDCKVAQQDHSYCTEDGMDCGPSTSSSSVPDVQEPSTSSMSVLDEQQCQGSSSLANVKDEISESDPTLSEGSEARDFLKCDISSDEFECEQYSGSESSRDITSRKRKFIEDSSPESSCVSKKRSRSSERKVIISGSKKDLKAKIKSSLFPSSTRKALSDRLASKKHRKIYVKRSSHSSSSDSTKKDKKADRSGEKRHSKTHSSSSDSSKKVKTEIKQSSSSTRKAPTERSASKKRGKPHSKKSSRSSSNDSHSKKHHDKHSKHKRRSREHRKSPDGNSSDTEEMLHPSFSKSASSGTSGNRRRCHDSSSEGSGSEESYSTHHSITKYVVNSKTKKSSKKHKRSKDKLQDKVKRSMKKSKHKKRSKSKRHGRCDVDSDYSERKKHKTKSRHRKKYLHDESSGSESNSYIKYKAKATTVKVKIVNDLYSSCSSD